VFHQQGFAQARIILEEDVPVGQASGQQFPQQKLMARKYAGYPVYQPVANLFRSGYFRILHFFSLLTGLVPSLVAFA
jgi:hypothetical protein